MTCWRGTWVVNTSKSQAWTRKQSQVLWVLYLFLILYADDTVIISESAEGLQKQLNDLYDYCNEWKLKVNTLKTKIVIFRNRGKVQATDKWYYDGNCIEVVNSFNYLGLSLNYNGKFTVTEKLIAS